MTRVALAAVATALAVALAPDADARLSETGISFRPPPGAELVPSWLSETFTDGTTVVRYPRGWIRNRTKRFGRVLSDNKSPSAAFVSLRYLPRRTYRTHRDFATLAARVLRPPDGAGTTLLWTQAARIGGRAGVEAALMWQVVNASPIGPTMRVFGIELASGRVALLVFAAERPAIHAVQFGWIKRSIRWR